MRPLLLLSNDDGYRSPGLEALREALERDFDVIVCAPASNQSAISHALTLHDTLRLERATEGTFFIDGTPADCVYTALHAGDRILPRRPDLLVSGMNRGPNLGDDVIYSGTVAAAREGAQRGIPALAVSAHHRVDQAAAARFGADIALHLYQRQEQQEGQARPPLLNLNIPKGSKWSLKATRLGRRTYQDGVIFRTDPRGRQYFWIGGADVQHEQTAGTDTAAWDAGDASLTPLSLKLDNCADDPLATSIAASMS